MFHRVIYGVLALAALLLLVLGFLSTTAHAATASAQPQVTLSAAPLGVNISPVDTAAANSVYWARMMRGYRELGPSVSFRYGGGVRADATNWQLNRDIFQCPQQAAGFTDKCSHGDPLSFQDWVTDALTVHGTGMVTANYGTGTPALAAAWATYIKAHHSPVTQIEIGNEPFGCSSDDLEITQPPVSDITYEPETPALCPYAQYGSGVAGLAKFAESYNAWAPGFIQAVHAADPAIAVTLPYAVTGHGAAVWNDAVLPVVKGWSVLSVDWYPTQHPVLTDVYALTLLSQIPARAAVIKSDLAKYAPGKPFVISEENISNKATANVCRPVGGVFAAASALSWLVQGAQNVDWWIDSDNNNAGSKCTAADYAMFDGTGYPQPPFWGYLMASKLAQPHAVLASVATDSPYLLEFHARLAHGHQAVEYVNLSMKSALREVHAPSLKPGRTTAFQYSGARPKVVTAHGNTKSLAHGVKVPAESITVIET